LEEGGRLIVFHIGVKQAKWEKHSQEKTFPLKG